MHRLIAVLLLVAVATACTPTPKTQQSAPVVDSSANDAVVKVPERTQKEVPSSFLDSGGLSIAGIHLGMGRDVTKHLNRKFTRYDDGNIENIVYTEKTADSLGVFSLHIKLKQDQVVSIKVDVIGPLSRQELGVVLGESKLAAIKDRFGSPTITVDQGQTFARYQLEKGHLLQLGFDARDVLRSIELSALPLS